MGYVGRGIRPGTWGRAGKGGTLPETHTKIFDYAEEVIATPRAHLRLTLRQDEEGLELAHDGRPLVRCYLTREGMVAGGFMAAALGSRIPPLGQTREVRVSTGVLNRAVWIASLDFSAPEALLLVERWLEEAAAQRGGSSDAL